MPTKFDAFADEEDSDEDESDSESDIREGNRNHKDGLANGNTDVPSFEDLSQTRNYEEIALDAIYGQDFSKVEGAWKHPIFCVKVVPPDTAPEKIGSSFTLQVQLGKKYPYVAPTIEFRDVKGLGTTEQLELWKQLKQQCDELAENGSPMVCDLVRLSEEFLLSHNIDPSVSAWEQMKAREQKEKDAALEKEKSLTSFMNIGDGNSSTSLKDQDISQHSDGTSKYGQHLDIDGDGGARAQERVNKELERQMMALQRAADGRRNQYNFDGGDLEKLEEESGESNEMDLLNQSFDDDINDDYDDPVDRSNLGSRYKSDFVDLGKLGEGGGGTVVKVRNRLDRRIYALKIVKLESELGNNKDKGRRENGKLKKEVITISRMTHKNIVRYYQAWIEGGGDSEESSVPSLGESSEVKEESDDESRAESSKNEDESDEDESASGGGFWGVRPDESDRDDEQSESEWSTDDDEQIGLESCSRVTANSDIRHFDSDDDLELNMTPLLRGLGGFENKSYSDLFKRNRKESISSEDIENSCVLDHYSSENTKASASSIMYIQMEYCSTTLRHLIDDGSLQRIEMNDRWKMIRQLLEALSYVHKRKIIHRDLKPGNIFLDAQHSIRLGDFGLATTKNKKDEISLNSKLDETSTSDSMKRRLSSDSITGGVGTTFYIAPEQEGRRQPLSGNFRNDYDTKADIFSLGVVIFEVFHPPFSTRMERADTLQQLRLDHASGVRHHGQDVFDIMSNSISKNRGSSISGIENWEQEASLRFPKAFIESVPKNCQEIILWCLQKSPENRPTAEALLGSDLIPRPTELDPHYLDEALQTIANPESESLQQIMRAMFNRHAMQHVEITFDTDIAAKAKKSRILSSKKAPHAILSKKLNEIGGFHMGDVIGLHSSAMTAIAMSAASSALDRAQGAGKVAKGELMRTATQHVAAVLAMASATSAASTGHANGVPGADPRVVKSVTDHLTSIFENHGAVEMKPPLLRPKAEADMLQTCSEVINERGINLLFPEDLQANFARSIGRGGGALSNVKRYNIDTIYNKSVLQGGHPKEATEASFDIVVDNPVVKHEYFTAETIMVICQVLQMFVPRQVSSLHESTNTKFTSPFWLLRLTHTRLTDAILDICEVPLKEAQRRACYNLLSRCSAPPPSLFQNNLSANVSDKSNWASKKMRQSTKKLLDELLEKASIEHGLPEAAAKRLRIFLVKGSCLPLPLDVYSALGALEEGTKKVRAMDDQRHQLPRRQKRYEDIGRSLRAIRNLMDAMDTLGIMPQHGHESIGQCQSHSRTHPCSYISLDLGLRQLRKHYHGHIFYQAIMLPNDINTFRRSDALSAAKDEGIKIAEGGRYDDLVRRFRPPGNFATSQVDQYTSASIPVCTGVRFFVGRLVAQKYVEAALSSRRENDHMLSLTSESDVLRRVLAHPFPPSPSVKCIIVGMNGFDSASLSERAVVAAHLWSEGISAEYIPHSGVMLSLLKRQDPANEIVVSDTNEWTLDQICGVCSLLKIPFVVVVQLHLLREKGSVRLRPIVDLSSTHNGVYESFVPVTSLASEIKERLTSGSLTTKDDAEYEMSSTGSAFDRQISDSHHQPSRNLSVTSDLECIYVDTDQFYFDFDGVNNKDQKVKNLIKTVKTTKQRAGTFIANMSEVPIIVVDLPFAIVRDFNSTSMLSEGPNIATATNNLLSTYPKHRKTLKTLAMCLDHLIRRQRDEKGFLPNNKSVITILVCSFPDDRFDLLTLDTQISKSSQNGNEKSAIKTKRERHHRR